MKPRLLIVEDDNDTFKSYFNLLSNNFNIRQCATMAEIPELLRFCPHAVILDLKLPDGNGGDMIPLIRKSCCQTKLIVVTGYVEKLDGHENELDNHNTVVFTKPFYWDDLESELNDLPGIKRDAATQQTSEILADDCSEQNFG